MRSSRKINLISYEIKPGAFSDEGEAVPVKRSVYANEYSTSLTNKLQAQTNGLRLDGRLEIYSFEYQGEEALQLSEDGDIHTILDVQVKGDRCILSYGEVIGDGR